MKSAHEDTSTLINNFIKEAEVAAFLLADRRGLPIECAHVQNALVGTLALGDGTELLHLRLTKGEILSTLERYDFRKFFPILLGEVTFEKSILPPGIPRRLVEQRVRHHGEVWQTNRRSPDTNWTLVPARCSSKGGLLVGRFHEETCSRFAIRQLV